MLYGLTNALVTWTRATAYLLDPRPIAALIACDRVPALASCVQVRVTGTPVGTVTVRGMVDGEPGEETLSWAGSAGFRMTAKRFAGPIELACDVADGLQIEAKALGHGGDPHLVMEIVRGPGHPVTITSALSRGETPSQGSQDERTHRIQVPYEDAWTPQRGDRVSNDRTGEVLEVISVDSGGSAMTGTPWNCSARRLEGHRAE